MFIELAVALVGDHLGRYARAFLRKGQSPPLSKWSKGVDSARLDSAIDGKSLDPAGES